MTIGPVDIAIIGFPGNKFSGEIVPIVRDLVASGTIRIIDLVFMMKDENGDVATVEIAGLDESLQADFVALDVQAASGMLEDDDVAIAGESLDPNSSALMILWENTWAAPFVAAVERADGQLVDLVRIPREAVLAQLEVAGLSE